MVQHLLEEEPVGFARLEVIEGPTGRRSWTDEAKGRIVAESFTPGAVVGEVARRHGLTPQHLTSWRRKARLGELVLPADAAPADPDTLEAKPSSRAVLVPTAGPKEEPHAKAFIELEADGVVLRLPVDTRAKRIAELASALRAAR